MPITIPMSANESISEEQPQTVGADFLYRLMLVFPGWASAILPVYSIFLFRVGTSQDSPEISDKQ